MMLSGLLLYIFDYGSDIYVAYRYWQNGDVWWFGMTVGFIVGPSIIVNITAIHELIDSWRCLAGILQLSFIFRYFEAINSLASDQVYFMARLRYLETIIESAPQWSLQGYIMLRQWKFPTYTVVSIVLSLLSLTWSIVSLEKARREEKSKEFNFCHGFLFSIIQLCTLIPRLSGIVIFAYVFRYYVFILIAIRWVILTVVVFKLQEHHTTKFLALSLLASFPYLFHASKTVVSRIKRRRDVVVIGYTIIVLETIVMVTLSLTIKMPDVLHVDVLKPIVIGLTAGGFFSATICFWCFYSSHDDDDDDDDRNSNSYNDERTTRGPEMHPFQHGVTNGDETNSRGLSDYSDTAYSDETPSLDYSVRQLLYRRRVSSGRQLEEFEFRELKVPNIASNHNTLPGIPNEQSVNNENYPYVPIMPIMNQ